MLLANRTRGTVGRVALAALVAVEAWGQDMAVVPLDLLLL